MGLMDFFKKDKKKVASNNDGLLRQAYDVSNNRKFQSFEEFKNSSDAKIYEVCYEALIAALAGHPQELYIANKDSYMFEDGKIVMEEALDAFVGEYNSVLKKGVSFTSKELLQFMLLDEGERADYHVQIARGNKDEFLKEGKVVEARISQRYNAQMRAMSGVEEEYGNIRRRM